MKKVFSISLIFVFLLSFMSPVLAEEGIMKEKVKDKLRNSSIAADMKEKRQEKMEEKGEVTMDKLQERAEKEINRRLESLNKLITRINEFKKLSASQKSSLTSQVQTEIDSLEALLVKIQADTDLETLRADVKSIRDSYRIYALFIPKIQIMGAADRMLNIADEMSTHAATLETKINEAEAAGNDVAELESLLVDMNIKIADAKTKAQNALDTVTPLTPAGFPDNKTELQSARQMVVDAHHSLNDARQDARKIIVGLMKFGKTETTPAVSPTP